ncbi:holin family protein [Roseobacter litoralis]|uniref:holin family protein n=1 Tax=Roseobacter litoralis TaxID=42443 RepID=UPI002494717C|nr:holin family protein [Roseobacter litoralis]
MGLIGGLLSIVFGNERNVVKETVEVFRANAEEDAARAQELRIEALGQYGREFESAKDSAFNRVMDGVNRVPRPALALGTLGLFLAAMVDPIWFAARMQGIALVPEPLWWLLGVIVSFYFGARHQVKSQQFQQSIAKSVALAPKVVENIGMLRSLRATTPGTADTAGDARLKAVALQPDSNAALEDWQSTSATPATK